MTTHQESRSHLGVPNSKYFSPGYSSEESTGSESDDESGFVRGYEGTRFIDGRANFSKFIHGLKHCHASHASDHQANPSSGENDKFIRDSKWKLYDPQPFLSHLRHPERKIEDKQTSTTDNDKDNYRHHHHHRFHAHGHPSKDRTPYDDKGYMLSAGGRQTRSLLEKESIPPSESESESDSQISESPRLKRASTSRYTDELNRRKSDGTEKIDENMGDLSINAPSKSTDSAKAHYKINDLKHLYYNQRQNTDSASTIDDEEGFAYKYDPPSRQDPNTDDLLRRKSIELSDESVKQNSESFNKPDLYQTLKNRSKSFNYNEYKNCFHGMLMTPEEESKPGFSTCEKCT
ncbi:hypothetical protein V1511DRAFT_36621 [Dipodascopsis uninucleata]